MIAGHASAAYVVRWRAPRMSMGWVAAATFAPDVVREFLLLAHFGWVRANLYSHSLPWSALLAVGVALLAWRITRQPSLAGVVVLLVASHVALDMVSGWKSLWVGGPHGLYLERWEQWEFGLELTLLLLTRRMAHRSAPSRWTGWLVVSLVVAGQGVYLVDSYRSRPSTIRCWSYPIAPCWTQL